MKQILLVDDDAKLLQALLRHSHPHRREWQVATASNGGEALRMARDKPFDLIVTGILMPEMDGVETAVAFRSKRPSVKVVAMPGGGRQVGKEPIRCARLPGTRATLETPFDFQVLRDTVRTLLEQEPDATHSPERGES